MLAQVDVVTAELAYREAYVKLMSLIGRDEVAGAPCHAP
jgi:hypothetical protein